MTNRQLHQPLMNMNQSVNQINQQRQMNPSYTMFPPQQFRNLNSIPGATYAPPPSFNKSLAPRRSNWKGKKVNHKPNGQRRMTTKESLIQSVNSNSRNINNPHKLNESQYQNSVKTQFISQKTTLDNNYIMSAPFAPRNTTSFIIRLKKLGGIAPLVSPCPETPSVLLTPILSPSRELLVDMAKEEWGVDGYGSMEGLIRLKSSPGHEMEEGGSSGSDLEEEEHAEVEKRLDHDLSRFEMVSKYPNGFNDLLENRVDDQDAHIAKLEEENLNLKEKLFFMEREMGDLMRRMGCLERARSEGEDIDGGEVVEDRSNSESDSRDPSEEVINNVEGEVGNEDEVNVGVENNENENYMH